MKKFLAVASLAVWAPIVLDSGSDREGADRFDRDRGQAFAADMKAPPPPPPAPVGKGKAPTSAKAREKPRS